MEENKEILNGHEEYLAPEWGDSLGLDIHRADQEAHLPINFTSDFGDIAQDLDFSDFLHEESVFGASHIDEAPFDAAINNLKKSKRRGLGKNQRTSFSEDDFDDPAQRKAFILLRYYKNEIFKQNASPVDIMEAATFIFGRSNNGELSFDLCCEVLNARSHVLRLRFHYEFFLKWMIFPVEFPFMIDPLPKNIENEILMYINEGARALAACAWVQPGISTQDIYSKARNILNMNSISATDQDMKKWLETLEDRYLMSRVNDNWYLTGRNPLLAKIAASRFATSGTGQNISWSKLW